MAYPQKAEKLKQAIHDELKKNTVRIFLLIFLPIRLRLQTKNGIMLSKVIWIRSVWTLSFLPNILWMLIGFTKGSWWRENFEYAIIDLQKVYEDAPKPMLNSLAEIVKARIIMCRHILILLGKVIRCESDDKIRNFRTSVTKDCMRYHNYAVSPLNPKRMSSLTSEEIQSKSALPNASSSWKRSIQI